MNIGIDLGTTNSALAFIDPAQAAAEDAPAIQVLEVPQYVAQGRIESRRTLPSFLYLAGPDADQQFTGVYAREQGALVPTQCVHSAKSWLSNPDVDRTAKILPWDAQEAGRLLSPVEVSTRILKHLADAWTKAQGSPMGEHPVVLTVPASFDEEARELTVMAAREAGIEKLTLLEEPAAAFYSWIANDLARSQKSLFDGQNVLVCDVGGGTSDFTLIRVTREGDRVDFTRTAVGKHLLLGGDNLDLTLAWLVESKLGKQLVDPPAQRAAPAVRGGQGEAALRSESEERRDHGAGRRIVAGGRHAQDRDPARRSAGAGAGRISAGLRVDRQAAGGRSQPVSRSGPAASVRSGGDAASGGVSRKRGRRASRRDSVQRRLLHSRNPAPARGGCDGALVRPPARDLRESRSGSGGGGRRGVLLLRALDRRGTAGARRTAARVFHRTGGQ